MISTPSTIGSIVVMVLAAVLPRFGITLGNETLTTTVETVLQLVLGLYVYFTHKKVVAAANRAGASL